MDLGQEHQFSYRDQEPIAACALRHVSSRSDTSFDAVSGRSSRTALLTPSTERCGLSGEITVKNGPDGSASETRGPRMATLSADDLIKTSWRCRRGGGDGDDCFERLADARA
jgi:hypothetical protein